MFFLISFQAGADSLIGWGVMEPKPGTPNLFSINVSWVKTPQNLSGTVDCPDSNKCRVGMGFSYHYNGAYRTVMSAIYVEVNKGISWDEAVEAYMRAWGASGSRSDMRGFDGTSMTDFKVCFGSSDTTVGIGVVSPPGSQCGNVVPVPAKCDFITADAIIQYGEVNASEVNGATANQVVTIRCDNATNVQFKDPTGKQGRVQLGLGVEALITVEGRSLEATIALPAQTSQVTVTSTLTGDGSQTGMLNGSAILEITIL